MLQSEWIRPSAPQPGAFTGSQVFAGAFVLDPWASPLRSIPAPPTPPALPRSRTSVKGSGFQFHAIHQLPSRESWEVGVGQMPSRDHGG